MRKAGVLAAAFLGGLLGSSQFASSDRLGTRFSRYSAPSSGGGLERARSRQ